MPTGSRRRRRLCTIALLVTAALLVGCGWGGDATRQMSRPADAGWLESGVARTTAGMVRGVVAVDHRIFYAIPYAAPPVGPLRWQSPQPTVPWSGMRAASKPGAWCIQDTAGGPDAEPPTSEDCLTLNVWTPSGATVIEKRPVMVWIHGGSFVSGSGNIYRPRLMVTRGGIVVVTVNYRLGALGFLAHPSLGAPGEVGNYGLADQQAALRWVRDNIVNFGGDPTRVTIAGESAGGMSVCDHMVAPGSAGLFRAAIIQSGPCGEQVDLPTAQRISLDYAATVGCSKPASAARCLWALPATKLTRSPWYVRFGTNFLTGPVTGTRTLPIDPVRAMGAGSAARVPVLIGTNHDEFTLFVALEYLRSGQVMTAADYPRVLSDTFGADGGAVLTQYPLEHYGGNASLAYSTAVTDGVFACVADRMADALARSAPVYAYEFNDRDTSAPEPLQHLPFQLGASHSLEMRYLFDIEGAPPLDAEQRVLSEQMIDYWSRFVVTGVPTAAARHDWPVVGDDPLLSPRMSFQSGDSHVINDFVVEHQCSFWATVGAPR